MMKLSVLITILGGCVHALALRRVSFQMKMITSEPESYGDVARRTLTGGILSSAAILAGVNAVNAKGFDPIPRKFIIRTFPYFLS